MKCKQCLSCLKIIRVENKGEIFLTRYCPLCEVAYTIQGDAILDNDVTKLAKEKYELLFGGVIL